MNVLRHCAACGKGLKYRWGNLHYCNVAKCAAPLCDDPKCEPSHMEDLHPDRRTNETAGT